MTPTTPLDIQVAQLEERVANMKEATTLQALEYHRRLDELNHAYDRAKEDRNKFVGMDLFYAKHDEVAKWRSDIDQWRSRIIGIAIGIGVAAGLAGGGVAGLIARLLQ